MDILEVILTVIHLTALKKIYDTDTQLNLNNDLKVI